MRVLCVMVLPHGNGLLISFVGVVCCDGELLARSEFDWLIRVFEKPCSDFWPLQMRKAAMLGCVPERTGSASTELQTTLLTLVSSMTAHMMRVFLIAILKLSSVSCAALGVDNKPYCKHSMRIVSRTAPDGSRKIHVRS